MDDPGHLPAPSADHNQLIAERREKLAVIRERAKLGGSAAFPNDFKPQHHATPPGSRAHEPPGPAKDQDASKQPSRTTVAGP